MLQTVQEEEAMASKLGNVAGIPVKKKTIKGCVLKNGIVIEDTFAEMFSVMETSPAQSLFFFLE